MSNAGESPAPPASIVVRGARTHNLRGIEVDLPRDRLVVLTGVSGSGKSSLAFDTIFAEGQRRYIECLSGYARQFLDQLQRPDVDEIEGLPPTVAIDQRAGQASPRSTVGTLTEIHDHLRLLFARVGIPHCPNCGLPIHRQTPEQMTDGALAFPAGTKVMVLAPLVRGRKGQHAEVFPAIRRAGLIRARVDGEMIEVTDQPPKLGKAKPHDIEAVVDRLVIREGIRPRLAESIDLALKLSEGVVILAAESAGKWEDHVRSVHLACPNCGSGLRTPEPRGFSFNSPYGACPTCQGLGVVDGPDPGTGEKVPCPACRGARLGPEALAVKVGGRSIAEVSALAVEDSIRFFDELRFDPAREPIAAPIVREIGGRLRFLREVGLGYLSLDRGSPTLSGGELQRARLATQLGAGLVGVCYVLDEPTAGLHPRDTDRLVEALRRLQEAGNSVLVVEHDEGVIRAADWVVDLGPGAGPDGGLVVAAGTPEDVARSPDSITGRYLKSGPAKEAGGPGRIREDSRWIEIRHASAHNLRDVSARIPVGTLTCVTGVSGSGKSTLVHDVLAGHWRRHHAGPGPNPGPPASPAVRVEGLDAIEAMVVVDQGPIGRSPRSTPATFTGTFDEIRRVYAATRLAKVRGYKASRFSFNAPGGRCEACEGQGRRRVPMQFLPDLYVTCEECRGLRFNRQTLEVRFKGKSIGEALELRVDEAREFFASQPRVLPGLNALHEVGVGYLTLGQSSTTLSGGEAQRIKLAAELGRESHGRHLYVLDEPTTGLHFADIDRLLGILRRLADLGNTLVVIEHSLDVIAAADWVIDLGPEAGSAGGRVVAMGTPEDVSRSEQSHTGRYLRLRGIAPAVPDRPKGTPARRPPGKKAIDSRRGDPDHPA
ncbi:UvrABC system protein A [Aquisphaera giovannonii]|uniref:UvrABC system protein A n=1 Tax=Aquisphaera giovannonii TaxID=406548 RepID=A0A5B9W7Z2_9BACT|nr:excinuclease ABC subunit UvrA [Aquisphaera giovannonii]QEH36354.1 UvrABC system protein A [Aquisphaera giovannonii]